MADKLVKTSTLLAYADEYRSKADEIIKRDPKWVTGDPQERRRDYLELHDYFVRLARD